MSYVRKLHGVASVIEHPADEAMNLDPAYNRPVEMVLASRWRGRNAAAAAIPSHAVRKFLHPCYLWIFSLPDLNGRWT